MELISIEEPDKILCYLNNNLSPNIKNKKERGEVFTPIELVKEMLDKLPKEVWSNPHLKWLDPAVGIGNFPVVAYMYLMEGLRDWERDEEKRRTHILENMLYMVEINEKNIIILNKLLCGHKYKLNIFEGDFLETHLDKIFGIYKYDIIMGNPPYQGTGRKKIYIDFINNILKIYLNSEGYLLFITPKLSLNFLLGIEVLQKKLNIFYNLIYFNANDKIKNTYFKKIGSDFCYYLISNGNYNGKTHIIFENGESKEIKLEWLKPISIVRVSQRGISIKNKVIDETHTSNLWGRYASRIESQVKEKNEKYKYKLIQKINTNDIEYRWTDKLHENHNKLKILYPSVGNKIIIDYKKELFPSTSFVLYILCENINECYFLKKLLNSKLYTYLETEKIIYGRSPLDFFLKNLIKNDIYSLPKKPTDQDIYNYYGITKQEQQLIEEVVNEK